MKKILITRKLIKSSEEYALKIFNVELNKEDKLLENKISNIGKINPQFIATGNIGCITQIANGTKIPILHTVEIIDWYTGGPKPEVLKKL